MHGLSKDELSRLLSTAKASRERDWLMILVAFHHGLRVSELIQIKAHDVVDGFLTVQRLKGSMRTVQALVESADPLFDEKTALIEYARKSNPDRPVFPLSRIQFWRVMRKHSSAAGLPKHKGHPHALKHSIALQTIHEAGVENVRQHLGHKSLSSTGAYLRVSDEAAGAAIRSALKSHDV